MGQVGRRQVLRGAGSLALMGWAGRLGAEPAGPGPMVDAHIHLFDPTRPGVIPWPLKTDTVLFKPALPARYRALAEPCGVVAAIAVECSPLAADNDWLLATAEQSDFMVGVIGDLDPALPGFLAELDRLRANPLFLGMRYGNLWERDLGARLREPRFVENMRRFARTGLVLESANPNPLLVSELLELTAKVDGLRLVVDHLPQAPPPTDAAGRRSYLRDLTALSQRAGVYVKGTEILRRVDGVVRLEMATYRPWLDEIWGIFGADRMLFGSDWPNSDTTATFVETIGVAEQYIRTRGRAAAAQYLWRNSVAAYGWKARTARQRGLLRDSA